VTEHRAIGQLTSGRVPALAIRRSALTPGWALVLRLAVHLAVWVPFVAGVVDCGGTSVRANIINVDADPEHVTLGMKVRLATFSLGSDEAGTEAVGFGFEPAA